MTLTTAAATPLTIVSPLRLDDDLPAELSPRIVRDRLAVRDGARFEPLDRRIELGLARPAQFRNQPRLAEAGLAEQRDDRTLALPQSGEPGGQHVDLAVAPDQRRRESGEPAQIARDRLGSGDFEGLHRRLLAFDLERSARNEVEQRVDESVRVRADENRPQPGRRLHPRRDVGRVAHCRVLGLDLVADEGEHRRAGVDTHAHLEVEAIALSDVRGVVHGRRLDIETRANRPFSVVLVRDGRTEQRKHSVAHEARDRPTVTRDRCIHEGEGAIHDNGPILRIELLGDGG
jgi:hypothetical protein